MGPGLLDDVLAEPGVGDARGAAVLLHVVDRLLQPGEQLGVVLAHTDAVFLGAVGFPGVPDHVSLWGLLVPIRRGFMQYVNMRPVRLLKGLESPLKNRGPADIDMVIVRENVEGEYSSVGGRLCEGTEDEVAIQQAAFTRKGCDRIMRYAFELAKKRGKKRHVTSATKSNGISISMPYWDERFALMKKNYPDVKTDQYHIDILCSHMVRHPDWFDVIVASNLFGDILSDLAPAVAAGIGIAPGANINPEKTYPSMFEPVHGSAPDIAGKGIANPIAMIASFAMCLRYSFNMVAEADQVEAAIAAVLDDGYRTRDIMSEGKTEVGTTAMGHAIIAKFLALAA